MTELASYSYPSNEDFRTLGIFFKDDVFHLICYDEDCETNIFDIPFPSMSSAKKFAKILLLEAVNELFS